MHLVDREGGPKIRLSPLLHLLPGRPLGTVSQLVCRSAVPKLDSLGNLLHSVLATGSGSDHRVFHPASFDSYNKRGHVTPPHSGKILSNRTVISPRSHVQGWEECQIEECQIVECQIVDGGYTSNVCLSCETASEWRLAPNPRMARRSS